MGRKIAAKDFIRIWQTSKRVNEVADRSGLALSSVASRASHYRKLGIPMKNFPTGTIKLDIESLKKLAEECLRKEEKDAEPNETE